ncbi:hypothetical protein [Deefgea sp. CFH1-16]|uniref:hypothetical protein n=1 Tax=Deefgea sp. CFH1-16 TaxID=2675457 RepID=UPI0015F431EB|nr:hypothetical protein [Deefgea sp. CFH1-16]MBM5574363.1 hypothetical protein [Deefgea sp. CFH1-16]
MISPDLAPLENLAKIGKLKPEPSDARESAGLIRSATVRLHDARNTALSIESRFDLAYNAAHSAALAALRAAGFRSDNRYLVFQCLAHTLSLPAAEWILLNQAHTKRNLAEYEGDLEVTESFVAELIEQVERVLQAVKDL